MSLKHVMLVVAGFCAGILVAQFPRASANSAPKTTDLSQKRFAVSIDEVRQSFVFADEFSGHYTKTVTLSDGTRRAIELTPLIHDGKQVVKLQDGDDTSYIGLNGTTTNGALMIQVRDLDTQRALAQQEGWPFH